MIIVFKNETAYPVILELGENIIDIKSGTSIRVDSKTERINFSCYLNSDNVFKTMKFPKFIVLYYTFILDSFYDVLLRRDETEIKFVEKEVKGKHSETYKFLDISGDPFEILLKDFKVKSSDIAKAQLSEYRKRDEKASKYLKVFDVLQSFFYIGVPGCILFFGIWYFTNILTALYITIPTAIVGVVIGLLIKKTINNFNKKLDRLTQNKNDLYVDENSYFQKEYILSVIGRTDDY